MVKGAVTQFDNGILGPIESWELYAVIVGAIVGLGLSQISLQPGDLPPAMASQSIATPVVGVILGVALFEETLHDTSAGAIASVVALAVMLAGIAALAMRGGSAAEPVVDPRLDGER